MAEIVVPGPVSGRRYGFIISGDRPTLDEQLRIDASIRQQEDQFAQDFEARRGIRPAGAEAGFLDYLGEFPKGLARGAVGIGETAALGIASLLPERFEDPTREFIRRGAYELKPQVDIGLEETVSGKFGEALGSFLPLIGASALPGGMAIAGGLAVGAGAGEASERARMAGATPEERAQALLPGALVGAAELLPIKFMRALGRGDALSIQQRLLRIAESAGVEGAQEAAAETAQNLIARGIYDPEQGAFTGTGEALGYGAGVGGLVQGLMDLAIPGRRVAAQTIAAKIVPPAGTVTPGPATANNKTTVQSGGKTVTRVKLSDGAVLEFDIAPTQAQIDGALAQYNASKVTTPALPAEELAPEGPLPDPTVPVTTSVLDQLGVPKGHPVYKRMQSGQYQTREEVLDALEDVADTVRSARVEGNVRTYLEQVRAADAGAAQPELGGFEPAPAGAGVSLAGQRGPEETGGAAAPDAGRMAVSGERVGAAEGAAEAQPAPLTDEEAFVELADQAEARRAAAVAPVEPPKVDVPGADWLKEQVAFNRELADRRGITAKIEELFARGLTAGQVRIQLENDGDLRGIDPIDQQGFVVGVRASLGIPSQMAEEGRAEFADWLKGYNARRGALGGTVTDGWTSRGVFMPTKWQQDGYTVSNDGPRTDIVGTSSVLGQDVEVSVEDTVRIALPDGRVVTTYVVPSDLSVHVALDVPQSSGGRVPGPAFSTRSSEPRVANKLRSSHESGTFALESGVDAGIPPSIITAARSLKQALDSKTIIGTPNFLDPTVVYRDFLKEALGFDAAPLWTQKALAQDALERGTVAPARVPERLANSAVLQDAVPLPVGDGSQAPMVMYDMSSPASPQPVRAIVVKPVNGVRVPFYLSTGQGGKTDVASGRWYPFFGITSGMPWFVKTSGNDINNYYGSPELRRVAEQLDAELGDVRGQDAPTVTRENDDNLRETINRDMHPNTGLRGSAMLALPKGQRVNPNDSEGTRMAIQSVLDRIGAGRTPPALTEAEPEVAPDTLKAARTAVREYVKTTAGIRATKGDIDKIAERVARTGETVDEAAAEVLTRAALEGRPGPRRAEPAAEEEAFPGFDDMPDETAVRRQDDITPEEIESRVAPVPEPEPEAAIARYDALDDQQKNALAAAADVPREGNQLVSAIADEPARFMRLMDSLAAPTPTPARPATEQMARNIIPGRTTGAAGQVIPEGIAPVPGRSPQARSADPYVGLEFDIEASRVLERQRREDTAQNRKDNENLRRQLAAWWQTNTSPELRSAVSDMLDTSRDLTSVADKRLVLQLLNTRFTKRDKTSANKAWAAYTYFRKHPDLMTALDAMAYDAVAGGKATKLTQEQRSEMSPGLVEYYEQTGSTWATPALEWVQTNLSNDANVLARARKRFYTPLANSALQRELAASKRQEKRVQARKDYAEWLATQGIALDETRPAARPLREVATPLRKGEVETIDTDFDALFSPTAALDMPMHPQVVAAIRRGDINAALDGLIATAGSAEASKLAAKLRPFVQNIQLAILDSSRMEDLNAVFGDGTRNAAAGVYIYAYPDAEMRAAEPYAPERIALRRELSETVALNEQTGLTPSTFLHELIHVATISTLENKSHPLTKQVEALLAAARKIMPAGTNGILNQYEFVSDGMTDPAFIEMLAQIDPNNVSFLQRLHTSLRNFLRQLIGLPPKKPGSAKADLDAMFDALLAPSTPTRDRGEIYLASRRVDTARATLNSMAQRVKEFKPEDMQDMRRIARLTGRQIPFRNEVKDFIIRASASLPFIVETAQRYFPTAPLVADLVRQHGAQQHRMSQRVDETMMVIQEWAKKNRDKIAEFDRIRFTATEIRMDPRKDRSEYDQFEMSYNVLDADGDVARTVTKRYRTRQARNDAVNRHNAAVPQGQTRAKGSYDPETDENKERLRRFDEIKTAYRQLGPEGQKAMNLAFELPEYFRNEMQRVVQIRLDAMLPGQRTMQERVYKKVFEKIFAESLINPYQALQRRGNFGLSYVGRDPSTQETDADGNVIPGTGDIKVFKHAFESARQRDAAANLLRQLDPAAGIDQIKFYELDKPSSARQRPSLEFAVALLNKLDEPGSQLGDPAIRDNILSLVFDASPEASFLNSYRQRKDVPGYIGDITPLGIESTISDTLNNIRANGMSLAARISDMEFRSRLGAVRSALDTELAVFEDRNRLAPFDEQAGNSEEARLYYRILNDYTAAPFNERANWARNLTAGGYALTLGFNVSTAAITFFQVPIIIGPYLSARYGGRSTMGALGIASRLLTSSGRERTIERVSPEGGLEQVRREVGWYDFSVSNLDFTDPKNGYLQQLYDAAENAGVFNRSLTQEILDETGAKGWVQKTAAYSGLMQHHAERYVRESTLLATYLAELKERSPQARGMGMKQFVREMQEGRITVPDDVSKAAADQAVYTSEMTNGSMLAASAPLLSQTNLGSVIYLFKRFPLSMMNMLWHTAKRAAASSNDPADRKIAALQFGGMMGSLGLLAGASGIPMFQTVAALWNLIKDDEDEDLETLIRTGVLGERGLTGLVNYYAGVDVSSRIGLSGVFYRPGFNTEDQPPITMLLEGFGGPVVGLLNKYTDRVPFFFQEGEYWRMTEALMPTAIGNAMKSIRFYTEGVRTLRHDPLIDDIGLLGAGAQFFGFASAEHVRQLAENNYLRGVDNAINSRIQKLLRRRYMAYRMGDRIALREVMEDIAEFNRTYPSAAIDSETMSRSLKSHQETTSRMHHGITYSKKNEDLLIRLASDFGNATAYAK